MTIGVIEYTRPDKPVSYKAIKHIATMAGKDIIRLAWSSLAPFVCKHYSEKLTYCYRGPLHHRMCNKLIDKNNLSSWFYFFFNLISIDDANALIAHLCQCGLFQYYRCVYDFTLWGNPKKYYVVNYAPCFIL